MATPEPSGRTIRLSWRDSAAAADLRACDCIAPEDESFSAQPNSAGELDWTAPTVLDPTAVVTPASKPSWLRVSVSDGRLRLRGTSDGQDHCVLLRIKAKCGEAAWLVNISQPCVLPRALGPTKIFTDTSGQTITEIRLSTEADVVSTTGLDKADVSAFGSVLVITGEVDSGPYTVTLSSPCGQGVVEGEIVREQKPEPPRCDKIRMLTAPTLANVVIGTESDVCYELSGTWPIEIDSFADLPLGLNPVLHHDDSTGITKLCLVGVPVVDRCQDDPEGCRSGTVVLSNCAGQVELPIRLFISLPEQPKPPFCVGMVLVSPTVQPIPSGYTSGFDVQALYFPRNTTVTFGVAVVGKATLDGAVDAAVAMSSREIVVDDFGFGSGTIFVDTAGSGCEQAYLYASHPTCAVASNFSVISPIANIRNDCGSPGGGP